MNIGLTGGIATGKSTVSQMLVKRGAVLIDADTIAREIMEPGSPVLDDVEKHFGADVLQKDGSLDRKRLGAIIFSDPKQRQVLEAITHPVIRHEMRERMQQLESVDPGRLVIADIPLLYESKLEGMYEEVMVVYVPRDMQIDRLMKRDDLNLSEATSRLNAQMDIELKKQKADIVIDNSQGLGETERQVDNFWRSKALL